MRSTPVPTVRGPLDPAADGRPPFLPSRDDPVVRTASGAIGGPWGRHGALGLRRFWTPLRVLLAFTLLTLALAWLQKSPCQDGAWTEGRQYTHLCYSDVIPLYYTERLNEGAVPYVDHPVEYPVLTGAFMGVAAVLARVYADAASELPVWDLSEIQAYFSVTALLLAVGMLVVTWSTARLAGRRKWDAAMVALSPLVVVHAFTNWDLFAMALAGAGLVAWQGRRPGLAGVLLGLGAAAKLYPALFFVPLLALCWRSRQLPAFWRAALGAAVAWSAVNLPVAAAYPESWRRFFELNRERPADFDSLWYGVDHLLTGSDTGSPPQVNGIASIAVLLALGAVLALGLLAPRRPRLPQLLFLAVAGFLLANKVWSPQYSLWLLPLAVLARPSWRALLAWQVTECLVWVPRLLWFLGTAEKGVGYDWFLRAVLLRDLALVVLVALVVRDVLRPERDLVRAADGPSGVAADDPAGGVLDDAADRGPLGLAGSREPWEDAAGSDGSDGSWDAGGSWPSGGSGTTADDRRNTT
jgi:uncharacterized membrane protein